MRIFWRKQKGQKLSHSARDYQALVRERLRENPGNRTLALAKAIGAPTMEDFIAQGDGHVAVLRHHGLRDGMTIYDLGCGCGRTAQALHRSSWMGSYTGADVVPDLLDELARNCPGYNTVCNYDLTIAAPDASLDMLFHWSVFTHLMPTESYIYTQEAFRALKPNGKMIFRSLNLKTQRMTSSGNPMCSDCVEVTHLNSLTLSCTGIGSGGSRAMLALTNRSLPMDLTSHGILRSGSRWQYSSNPPTDPALPTGKRN